MGLPIIKVDSYRNELSKVVDRCRLEYSLHLNHLRKLQINLRHGQRTMQGPLHEHSAYVNKDGPLPHLIRSGSAIMLKEVSPLSSSGVIPLII